MQSEMKAREEHENSTEGTKDNSSKFVKVIKEEAHDFRETKCDMAIVTQAAKALSNIRQGLSESLPEHTTRLEDASDIVKTKCGGHVVIMFIMAQVSK